MKCNLVLLYCSTVVKYKFKVIVLDLSIVEYIVCSVILLLPIILFSSLLLSDSCRLLVTSTFMTTIILVQAKQCTVFAKLMILNLNACDELKN